MASDVMEVYSAGVALGKDISSRAVRILKAEYNIDLLEEGHYTKLFSEIPEVDMLVTGTTVQATSDAVKEIFGTASDNVEIVNYLADHAVDPADL